MGEGLGGLVVDVATKGCEVTCGCDIGVYGEYVDMARCVIYWLGWSICVCSEVLSASME